MFEYGLLQSSLSIGGIIVTGKTPLIFFCVDEWCLIGGVIFNDSAFYGLGDALRSSKVAWTKAAEKLSLRVCMFSAIWIVSSKDT